MKNILPYHPVRMVVLLVMLAGLLTACEAQPATDDEERLNYTIVEDLGETPSLVAVVESEYGRDTLTADVFDTQLQRLTRLFPQIMFDPNQTGPVKASVVDRFVFEHLIKGEAERRGLEVDSAQIDANVAQVFAQASQDSNYAAVLAEIPEDELRSDIAMPMLGQAVMNAMMEDVADPTEDEVQAFIDELPDQLRAQHILLQTSPEMSPEQMDSIKTEARALLDSVKAGVDFSELARRHSEGPSAPQGGDLGYFNKGQMVPPFDSAAFALADSGDVTDDVVQTSFGFHIIRLLNRRTPEVPAGQARQMLMQQIEQDFVDRFRSQATVHLNPNVIDASFLTS